MEAFGPAGRCFRIDRSSQQHPWRPSHALHAHSALQRPDKMQTGWTFAFASCAALAASTRSWSSRVSRQSIASLRQKLQHANGLRNLDIYCADGRSQPDLAAEVFRDAGFVLLPNALESSQLKDLLEGCHDEERKMLARDQYRHGNRGSGRYSMGEAQQTGHLLHRAEWASLIDLEAVTPVLQRIFGESGYVVAGAGGDFVLGGVHEYQPLHVDLNFPGCHARVDSPVVTLNVAVTPLSWENGPTRIIPGTHTPQAGWPAEKWEPPQEDTEPEDWRHFTFCPLPAGTAILRDNRAWHGGTPNLSSETRFLPNVEFAASWWCRGSTSDSRHLRNPWVLAPQCMPRSVYNSLSDFGKEICRLVVTDDADQQYGVRDIFAYPRC